MYIISWTTVFRPIIVQYIYSTLIILTWGGIKCFAFNWYSCFCFNWKTTKKDKNISILYTIPLIHNYKVLKYVSKMLQNKSQICKHVNKKIHQYFHNTSNLIFKLQLGHKLRWQAYYPIFLRWQNRMMGYIYIYISEPGYIGQSNSILTVSHRAPINSRSLS